MARSRIFIAAEIDDAVRQRVVVLQRGLALIAPGVKWVEPPNLHLTVLFLGEVEDRDLHALHRAVTKACAKHAPFALRLGGIGAFPTPRRPKTLWAGVTEGAAELQALHAAIEDPLLDLGGYRQEERAYTPHLTLGRVTDEDATPLAAEIPKQQTWSGGQCEVAELTIFTSELRKSGPEYTVVGRAPLAVGG
jgi:2'-5' RNA ligase